jgi:hypothetical protein
LATPCPAGTYSSQQSLTNASQCLSCTPGSYCATLGLTAPTGNCSAGYYCTGGSSLQKPGASGVPVGFGGICPVGSYCLPGSDSPIPCPAGTYRSLTLGLSLSDCSLCTPGRHCNVSGLTAPTGVCDAGYYCITASQSPHPTPDDWTGGICPPAHYCPAGSPSALPCTAGTYANRTGLIACDPCPAGYYCPAAQRDPTLCPIGSYCPPSTGTAVPACPLGTFGNATGLTSALNCQLCTPGSYCSIPGLSSPNGICQAGYYCPLGALNQFGVTNITGTCDSVNAKICPPVRIVRIVDPYMLIF